MRSTRPCGSERKEKGNKKEKREATMNSERLTQAMIKL